MRTTKPISTISYNSHEFLLTKLTELRSAKIISFWAVIYHFAEDDEARKDHFHVYIEPSKILQTEDLRSEFIEFDPQNPSKPLGCIQFTSSKFDPWYMYCLHDKKYLASIGQSRKFHYTTDQFIPSDDDDFYFKVKSVDMLSLSRYADMEDAIEHGLTWAEYFARGTVPVQLVGAYERAWHLLIANHLERNGHPGHEDEPSVIEKYNPYLQDSESNNNMQPVDPDASIEEIFL